VTKKQFHVLGIGVGEQMTESLIVALQDQELVDEGVVISALVDPRLEVARQWAEHFGIAAVFPDMDDAMDSVPVDAVVLAVPHSVHHQLAARGLLRRKHVLLEKPFTESGAQAADLIQMAGTDLVLTPDFQYPIQAENALARVARGELGTVRRGRSSWMRQDGIPDRPSFWNTRSGGVLPDLASHLLSVKLLAFGSRPIAVMAHGSNRRGRARYGDAFVAFDTIAGTMLFEDGRHAWLEASWCADVPEDTIEIELHGDEARMVIPLMGAQLDVENYVATVFRGVETTRGYEVVAQPLDDPLPTGTEACFVLKMRNFVRACRGREALDVRADLALDVRLTLDAFQASAEAGGELTDIATV
jgi:predicted dehydrogenase